MHKTLPTPDPGLYPAQGCRPTDSEGERIVYERLRKNLPEGWSAWHSLKIRTPRGHLGEGDFVLAVPHGGLLLVEVKGGQLEERDGHWYQNGKKLDTAPLAQGLHYRRKLLDRFAKEQVEPGFVEVIACFPETHFVNPPSEDDLRDHVIGGQELEYLGDFLTRFAKDHFPQDRPPGDKAAALVHHWWGETWVPRLPLGQQIRYNEGQRLQLDEQQLAFREGLFVNSHVRVTGPAGSGKTLLALDAARREAADGRKVLFLCFTEPLAQWLAFSLNDTDVTVDTARRFAAKYLKGQGEIERIEDKTGFWRKVSVEAAALLDGQSSFDTVIIDEAQDFHEDDWLLVDALGVAEKRCFVFHDPLQQFWDENHVPAGFDSYCQFLLNKPYRCPEGVWQLALRYVGEPHDEKAIRWALAEKIIEIIPVESGEHIDRALTHVVSSLQREDVAEHDMALVSLAGEDRAHVVQLTELAHHPVRQADAEDLDRAIVADTFLRFKGLERSAIIITGHELASSHRLGVRMHIALTRAFDVVRIVGVRGSLEEDEVLARFL